MSDYREGFRCRYRRCPSIPFAVPNRYVFKVKCARLSPLVSSCHPRARVSLSLFLSLSLTLRVYYRTVIHLINDFGYISSLRRRISQLRSRALWPSLSFTLSLFRFLSHMHSHIHTFFLPISPFFPFVRLLLSLFLFCILSNIKNKICYIVARMLDPENRFNTRRNVLSLFFLCVCGGEGLWTTYNAIHKPTLM